MSVSNDIERLNVISSECEKEGDQAQMNAEEEQRIALAKKGDTTAMAELFQQHYSFLYKYLLKVTMNPSTAEDTAQDTVIRCMENIARYNGTSSFSSWMITIGTRIYLDQVRRKKRERKWFLQEREQGIRKMRWQMQNRNEKWSDLLDSLSRLSDDHRIAILLKHYYGYSYEEIGEMLGVPAGTIKSRTSYGIKILREEMNRNV